MIQKLINNHIVPRHHLKQFVNDEGCIFTYPHPEKHKNAYCIGKGGGNIVKNTAIKPGVYSPRIEATLDRKFERRGSQIARKILNKEIITTDEKTHFAKYLASFIYRALLTERLLQKLIPSIGDQLLSVEAFLEFKEQTQLSGIDLEKYYATLHVMLNDPSKKGVLIRENWEKLIEAEHPKIDEALLSRDWWVAEAHGSEFFITGDHPLFYSRSSGIGDKDIQITFPLSQRMALVLDGVKHSSQIRDIKYYPAGRWFYDQVDLINKRTARNSKWLYSPKRDPYIQSLLDSRISADEERQPILRGFGSIS